MKLWRRTFLAGACGGSAAGAAAQSLPAPPAAKILSSVSLAYLPGQFPERLAVVARAGIQSVELLGEEHVGWAEAEIAQARRSLRSFNLAVDTVGPMPGSPAPPAFMTGLSRQLAIARKLEAPMLLMPLAPREPRPAWVENCRRAGDLAARSNITVLVQALETESASDAARLVKEVDHEHVRLLYDVHSEHARTGDALKALEFAGPLVKVFHVADSPDRRDPGSGSIPFDAFYKAVVKIGFEGHIAMAYRPPGDPAASLIRAVDAMRRSLTPPPSPLTPGKA